MPTWAAEWAGRRVGAREGSTLLSERKIMRLATIMVLLLGLATAGVAWVAQVRSIAAAASIVSGIADLRQADNLEKCQAAEAYTSRQLRSIRESFVPIMWLGGLTAASALMGLVVAGRKQKDHGGQQPPP